MTKTLPTTPGDIRWRLHLSSPPAKVYPFLAAADGRARFWAESARDSEGVITFHFPNGLTAQGRILEQIG
jgi:uncharacterized protein YndB with AHSA1/START domain